MSVQTVSALPNLPLCPLLTLSPASLISLWSIFLHSPSHRRDLCSDFKIIQLGQKHAGDTVLPQWFPKNPVSTGTSPTPSPLNWIQSTQNHLAVTQSLQRAPAATSYSTQVRQKGLKLGSFDFHFVTISVVM